MAYDSVLALKEEMSNAPPKAWKMDPSVLSKLSTESRDLMSRAFSVYRLFPWGDVLERFNNSYLHYAKLAVMLEENSFPPELYVRFLLEQKCTSRYSNGYVSKNKQRWFLEWARKQTDRFARRSDKVNWIRGQQDEQGTAQKLLDSYFKSLCFRRNEEHFLSKTQDESFFLESYSDILSGIFLAVHALPSEWKDYPDDIREKIERDLRRLDFKDTASQLYHLSLEKAEADHEEGFKPLRKFLDERYVRDSVEVGEDSTKD